MDRLWHFNNYRTIYIFYSMLCPASALFRGEGKNNVYEFPIIPEKRKEFQTYQEMIDTCQIPTEILKIISIEGLVKTCINDPLAFNLIHLYWVINLFIRASTDYKNYMYAMTVLKKQ